jgi:MFS family permease
VKPAFVAVATMMAIQVMISLSVLSLGVMMPAVAAELEIDAKLVGVFTALIYAVAAALALAAAAPIVQLGAVRVCQAALLMAATGLACNALAFVAATVIAVLFIGAAQGPINPASAHILAQRVPREYFGMVFSVKQTGTPIGFALAGVIFPALIEVAGWRGASLVAAGMLALSAVIVEPLRPRLDVRTVASRPSRSIWRSIRFVMGHPQLRVLGWSAFVYVIAQLTFTFYLVTYLYEHCGLSIARAGALLALSQIVGAGVRLLSGGAGDRIPRMKLLGWTGVAMAVGCIAIGLLGRDTPFWLIALVVTGYGSVVISWNGTSQAEFAHLSPPGETAAVAAVQTSLSFLGAVIGPPAFALVASLFSYRMAFFAVAICVLAAAIWQIAAAVRASSSQPAR